METRADHPGVPPSPDEVPVPAGGMCGACGSGRYLTSSRRPGRMVCTRCGNGRPAAA